MTDRVDDVARRSAADLHQHVVRTTDTEAALLAVTAGPGRRRPAGRLLAVAASVALLAVGVTVVVERAGDDGPGDARVTIDTDRDLVAAPLALAGPRDGRDSLGLPITVEPATGLQDGQVVTATGSGFEPGESVGIVMCSRAAGRPDLGGAGAGVQACDIGRFEQVTADAEGVASGTFEVRQALTTPYTGTIDCAASAEECIVAMGALADYDRSGGSAIAFDDGLVPLELPSLDVSPTDGLTDGDVIRLTGAGWDPGAEVHVSICSADPASCWQLGDGPTRVGDDGTVDVEARVWRYLPHHVPGTYVDCAVSSCLVRTESWISEVVSDDPDCRPEAGCEIVGNDLATSAAPVRVSFAPGGEPPVGAALEVTPSTGVAAGDVVEVVGDGHNPHGHVWLELCATRLDAPADPEGHRWPEVCHPLTEPGGGGSAWDWLPWVEGGGAELRADADGRFGIAVTLPALGPSGMCLDEACETFDTTPVDCAEGTWACDLRTQSDVYYQPGDRPTFSAAPVPLTYRPG